VNDDIFKLIMTLATQGLGFTLATIFGYIAYKKDAEMQALSQRILRSALSQTKDSLRQEHAIATLKEVHERRTKRPRSDTVLDPFTKGPGTGHGP
jgi:hypothetical protein